ncbi:helix-loop-helix domain-containing protein [Kocuria palustris]|nr:helix-loop-helix domain-containing protein [Kocuria palustris]
MPSPPVAAPPPSAPQSHQIRPKETKIIVTETTANSKETDCDLRKLKFGVRRWKDANADDKARYRKARHNVIERNRRTLILNRIDELATLVPPLMIKPLKFAVEHFKRLRNPPPVDLELFSNLKTGRRRLLKKTVLTHLIDYTKHLLYVVEQQELERARLQHRILILQQAYDQTSFPRIVAAEYHLR